MPRTVQDLEHLSYSSISSYLLCPRAWKFHYLDQVQTPTSAALVFGSAFHNALEDYVHTKTCGTSDGPLSAYWSNHWQAILSQNVECGIVWNGDTPETLNNLGVRMFSDPDTIALVDALQPLVVEERPQIERLVELHVPGVPLPVIGYIDLIEADGVPADFKTSARSWSQDQADSEMQPTFYLAALNQLGCPVPFFHRHEKEPVRYFFRHYVFVKTKSPKVQIWESTRTINDLFWLFGLIADVWHSIEAGCFPPNPGTWKCSPKWCEYFGICRGGE